jgi:hypothetical protein
LIFDHLGKTRQRPAPGKRQDRGVYIDRTK